ncbi:DMT family transporter [Cytobacillus kochii]|uniref:DMT family transporter n=1 Tax=Cytobacillus kochii TaxID=859143 RepID=UPI001CD4AA23|nr:multidrug efflux SMR transporter [Cytobacillus kochii]MCA1027996.1 multidrug efflux SMR transporter [Cytobacillus kochii]MCM3323906.1 multidrug efflux SMR transporter [Cytobacillus kochii]MCM3346303.1 multidrug efflux SMR transporter [Cytobacillus kochii]MDM5205839.1 multidrug efflux SMR transporter [Cytobacillus kochii]
MGWILVILAAISEITGVIGLKKYSEQKTIRNAVIYMGGFGISFALLYASFQYLQVSIAYTVWIGIGTAGAVLLSMFLFGEPKSNKRIISVLFIIVGVIGLKATS